MRDAEAGVACRGRPCLCPPSQPWRDCVGAGALAPAPARGGKGRQYVRGVLACRAMLADALSGATWPGGRQEQHTDQQTDQAHQHDGASP